MPEWFRKSLSQVIHSIIFEIIDNNDNKHFGQKIGEIKELHCFDIFKLGVEVDGNNWNDIDVLPMFFIYTIAIH